MDDSFRVRVEKTFGSLAATAAAAAAASSSSSSSHTQASLWCLTDEEIEKREWNRAKGVPDEDPESKPYPSGFDGFFSDLGDGDSFPKALDPDLVEADVGDADEDDDDEDDGDDNCSDKKRRRGVLRRPLVKPEDLNDDEWDIRSSIGLDCTLDNEEEEDAYDKVAVGDERTGDCLYMGDVADYKIEINSCNELPNTFKEVTRDSRADRLAAETRLKEDAEAAGNFTSLRVSHDTVPDNNTMTDGVNLKSILKKRGNQLDSKMEKRVRFDPECKDEQEEEEEEGNERTKNLSFVPQDSNSLPDYLRNPSKYTHYTFDSSSDVDEVSNQKAYMDFLNLLKGPGAIDPEDDIRKNPPKTVTFTPKKRAGDNSMENLDKLKEMEEDVCKEEKRKVSIPVCIAESEVCAMEEDEPIIPADNNTRKKGRQYRVKASSDLVDDYGS